MSKTGGLYENPVTGERSVVRLGTEESGGGRLVADLYVSPGGAVACEHVHPGIEETFDVVFGSVGFLIDGYGDVMGEGSRLVVPPGVAHDWRNTGAEEAHVVVGLRGDERDVDGLVTMISNLFRLARDGKTDPKGRPNLLQAALFGREFDVAIRFVEPPRVVCKALFGVLAPVARLLVYRATYPQYGPSGFVEVGSPSATG